MNQSLVRKWIWGLFAVYLFILLGNLLFFRLVNLLFYGFNFYFYQDDGFHGGLINPESLVHNANIIPLKTIWMFLTHYNSNYFNFNTVFYNILLNIAAFMPLGVFLPLLFKKMKGLRFFVLTNILGYLLIEVLQLLLHLGQFDIDDVILNTVGGILGFYLQSFLSKRIYLIL